MKKRLKEMSIRLLELERRLAELETLSPIPASVLSGIRANNIGSRVEKIAVARAYLEGEIARLRAEMRMLLESEKNLTKGVNML